MSWARGRWGARMGAENAATTQAVTSPSAASASGERVTWRGSHRGQAIVRRGGEGARGGGAIRPRLSAHADPRVDKRIRDVDDEVDEDVDRRHHEPDAHDRREVQFGGAAKGIGPKPRPR